MPYTPIESVKGEFHKAKTNGMQILFVSVDKPGVTPDRVVTGTGTQLWTVLRDYQYSWILLFSTSLMPFSSHLVRRTEFVFCDLLGKAALYQYLRRGQIEDLYTDRSVPRKMELQY